MKYIYLGIYLLLFALLTFTGYPVLQADQQIVVTLFAETGVPNAVSGILLRNRLFDTICEVMVFTAAVMTASTLLSHHSPPARTHIIRDHITLRLLWLGTTIGALICLELALRGHLSPGGGFAAGVAGGTAMGLVAISSEPDELQAVMDRRRLKIWEKISVFVFLACAMLMLSDVQWTAPFSGVEVSSALIPVLNVLITIKVAIGAWAIMFVFIRYRGLF